MDVRLDVDTAELDRWTERFPGKLRYAVAYRINRTVERVRSEKLFPHIRAAFRIRTPETARFFFGDEQQPGGAAGKFPRRDRATPQRLWAEFGTGSMERRRWGGKGGPVWLPGFEKGEMRQPVTPGARRIAAPLPHRPARPSLDQPVPRPFRVANLRLQAYYRGARIVRKTRGRHRRGMGLYDSEGRPSLASVQGVQFRGLQRTFLLPWMPKAPLGGILQRYRKGRWVRSAGRTLGGIRMIYKFIPPFRLDTRLRYEATVQAEAPAIFRQEMALAWEDAVRHADEKALRRRLAAAVLASAA